ncbi:MAG: hypothetical protein IJ091_09240 [Oscillospiraceae bacterium]|nr:hypothetical protein [Oscillospiraceae bacterium]
MKLFYKVSRPDPEMIKKIANTPVGKNSKKTYGQIMGFRGVFLSQPEDFYLSDSVEKTLEEDPKWESELLEIVERFQKKDWGLYVKGTKIEDYNQESLWFGADREELGLYETKHGQVYVHMDRDDKETVIYSKTDPTAEALLYEIYGELLYDFQQWNEL